MVNKITKNGITFIIPCYNPSIEDLEKCLESLSLQVSCEDKILIVNDGSDNEDIIKRIAKQHKNTSLINIKINSGVSNARNQAIKIAKTRWLTFVDSDDFILPNTLKRIREQLAKNSQTDILVCSIRWQKADKTIEFPLLGKDDTIDSLKNDVISSVGKHPRSIGIAVGKFYRTQFLQNNGISFVKNISRAEDNIFFLDILSLNPSMTVSPIVFYCINDNPNSATHKFSENVWCEFSKTLDAFARHMKKNQSNNNALMIRRGKYVLISSMNEFRVENPNSYALRKKKVRKLLESEENKSALKKYRDTKKSVAKRFVITMLIKQKIGLASIVFMIRNKKQFTNSNIGTRNE
ncbi:glycosyltransferase family 2 protein [Candidatus Saccharibacteria bacterium]|nr:glycosyltransferase family 2 protein [Candidatus Saccharibacteria bacterium]